MLTFEGQKFQGAQAIVAKLNGLQFGLCKITLATQDFQPSISGGILVFTTGNIQVQILHWRCLKLLALTIQTCRRMPSRHS